MKQPTRYSVDFNDVLKWVVVLVPLFGVCLYVSGMAYLNGFWIASGVSHLAQRPLQEIAYLGFIGPTRLWLWSALMVAGYALYIAILSISFRAKGNPPRWLVSLVDWLVERLELDSPFLLQLAKWLLAAALSLVVGVGSMTVFVSAAQDEGRQRFQKVACGAINNPSMFSTIKTSDGGELKGLILERSATHVLLINSATISAVSFGTGGRLEMSTPLSPQKCM